MTPSLPFVIFHRLGTFRKLFESPDQQWELWRVAIEKYRFFNFNNRRCCFLLGKNSSVIKRFKLICFCKICRIGCSLKQVLPFVAYWCSVVATRSAKGERYPCLYKVCENCPCAIAASPFLSQFGKQCICVLFLEQILATSDTWNCSSCFCNPCQELAIPIVKIVALRLEVGFLLTVFQLHFRLF